MVTKRVYEITWMLIAFTLLMMAMFVWKVSPAWRSRSSLKKKKGEIIYIDSTKRKKYFEINQGPLGFEIYNDRRPSNRAAIFNNAGVLKPGDTITVYYRNDTRRGRTTETPIVYFIDRGTEEIYVRGFVEKRVFFIIQGVFATIIVFLLIRWQVIKRKCAGR